MVILLSFADMEAIRRNYEEEERGTQQSLNGVLVEVGSDEELVVDRRVCHLADNPASVRIQN